MKTRALVNVPANKRVRESACFIAGVKSEVPPPSHITHYSYRKTPPSIDNVHAVKSSVYICCCPCLTVDQCVVLPGAGGLK